MASASGLRSAMRSALLFGVKRDQASPLALLAVSTRGIAGKAMREEVKKPPPFPYEKRAFHIGWYWLGDRTTLRFDENTKVVVVEGAHAVGKSNFAKELAEELGMKYYPKCTMDDYFLSCYGKVDLRDYKELFLEKNRPYDEKDWARDPMSVKGCTDRMTYILYGLKLKQYLLALRHLFNTGQGVVLEGSPYSDYCHMEAAYNAGWIDRESKRYIQDGYRATLHYLMRPNLILYLDAPADVVQKKIQSRGNEWDKNSPVWTNTEYINDVYGLFKQDYLKQAQPHSHVLVYDWSEPGDTELVVEDIEKLNFDYWGQFEEPQKDWRLYNDEYATVKRIQYSNTRQWIDINNLLSAPSWNFDAENMWYSAEENRNFYDIFRLMPHHRYRYGFNADAGDKGLWWKVRGSYQAFFKDMPWIMDSPTSPFWYPRLPLYR